MATPQLAFFSGESYQNTHQSGQDVGKTYYILMLNTKSGGKVMLYIAFSGHKHFSETNQLATLSNAVLSCEELLADANREVDGLNGWNKEFTSQGVKFRCHSSKEIGQCIKLYHSESAQAYKSHNLQRTVDRFNEKPRYGGQL